MPGKKPGTTCQYSNPQNINDGTLCRQQSSPNTPLNLCEDNGEGDFSWGYSNVVYWKLWGGKTYLYGYKDAWVRAHKELIVSLSKKYNMPPELLGGVAWIETGGKPYSSKYDVFLIRYFDHMGDPWMRSWTITKDTEQTSVKPLGIQMRRAAEEMGVDFNSLSLADKNRLFFCVSNANNALAIAAKHLWDLKQIDFPNLNNIGKDEIRVIGARYNRGPDLTLDETKKDTSYGNAIVNHSDDIKNLLK